MCSYSWRWCKSGAGGYITVGYVGVAGVYTGAVVSVYFATCGYVCGFCVGVVVAGV